MKAEDREYSIKRFAVGGVSCPSCHAKLEREAKWCEGCGFTGAETLRMFGERAPELQPILDPAGIWSEKGRKMIGAELRALGKRFPQIKWRICLIALEADVNMPLFGFWLFNASPLAPGESAEDRAWTILLVVDSNTGRTSVTTGYRTEVWLSERMWLTTLAVMAEPLGKGLADLAVVNFLKRARKLFDTAWERAQIQLTEK
jgi:hypothetical protein